MKSFFQKGLSLALVLLLSGTNTLSVFATGANFSLDTFTIIVNSGWAISGNTQANPGDTLSMLVSGTNNGSTLTNLVSRYTFSSVVNISNTNPGLTTSYKSWAPDKTNISASLFSPPSSNTAPVSDTSANGDIHDLYYTNVRVGTWFSQTNLAITNQFLADSYAGSNILSSTVFVNVRPHISDYYFEKADGSQTTNQIQGSDSESVNLVLKVKDYNGCTNIDGGTVTADLSSLGLGASIPLSFVGGSCATDGKTVTFKKSGITTIAALGTYNFSGTNFTAIDLDGNQNTLNDPNTTFDNEDKNTSLSLVVVVPAAPTVTISSVSNASIWGATKLTSALVFSASQNSEFKVVANGDGNCSTGTILGNWTGSGSYSANTATGITVSATSLPAWSNTVFVCFRNTGGNIGSANTIITKDVTAPILSAFTYGPASVTTQSVAVSYLCSENGEYRTEIGGNGTMNSGTFVGSGAVTANSTIPSSLQNSIFSNGSNVFYTYCIDNAGNFSTASGSVMKTPPTPSMAGQTIAFADNDIDYDGLDGRDLSFSWNSANALAYGVYFESYRLYLLPSNIAFNASSQSYTTLITSGATASFAGDTTITKDSTNTSLVSGGSYKTCIAIMGTNGNLGTEGCTAATTLTADTVSHPTILSAQFTGDTTLELTTDAMLAGSLTNHSGGLVTFVRNGSTFTGTSVSSVNGTKLTITIPSLGNLAATGGTLLIQTGAIRASGGGFNNFFTTGGLVITDGQSPTVVGFSTGTISPYAGFYSGSLAFNYTLAETMAAGGKTKIVFTRNGGNTDSGSPRTSNITDPTKLSVGSKSLAIDLVALGLVSGTSYSVQFIGQDLANNSVNSPSLSSIKFDNTGPAAPTITALTLLSTLNPTFAWLAPLDDLGNGSGIKQYNLSVYNGLTCSLTAIQTPTVVALSYALLTALSTDNADYSWKVSATDNMNNTGSGSSCDDFHIDTRVPTITSGKITDTVLVSTVYSKSWDAIQITASIANSDSAHIWLDASGLAGSALYNNVQCSAPTAGVSCSYVGGVATYSFVSGFMGSVTDGTRQVQFHSQNPSGGLDQTAISSITSDSTAPTVAGAITAPIVSTIWGGTTQNITWNAAGVTDNLAIAYVKLEYSSNTGASWTLVSTGANNGSYTWNISALSSGIGYQVRLTAFDSVGNSASTTSSTFSIDKTPPTIPGGTITLPSAISNIRWGQSTSITWNNAGITDNMALPATPILLEYSVDGGTNWTSIANNLSNNGSYAWSIGVGINTAQAKIRLTVTDSAGNSATLATSSFIIDSTNPTLTTTYAGGDGSTPPNGKYINNTGLDITANATDIYLSGVTYTFQNLWNSQYWNGSSYSASQIWNTLCTATWATCNVAQTVSPSIINAGIYRLILKSTDKAGNSTTGNPSDYVGDTIAPTLTLSTASGTYFSGSLAISGTASDVGSALSSVKIAIKKGANWWNGTDWSSVSEQQLAATTANSYTAWSYGFTPPPSDTSGQSYQTTVYAYDQAYKTNNTSSGVISATLDTSAPTLVSTGFWIEPAFINAGTGGVMKGGSAATIRWTSGNISDNLSGLATSPIKLEYWNGSQYLTITGASLAANSGSFAWTSLPLLDLSSTIRLTATDKMGNSSSSISPAFVIDSTPPTISSVETIGDTLGKINGLIVRFSENINAAGINMNQFSYSKGVINTSAYTIVDNQTVQFSLTSATGTTSLTGSLTYAGTSVLDIAGNLLAGVTKIVTDTTSPIITSAEIYDTNANGKTDQIRVYWSEPMTSTTNTSAWTINAPIAWVGAAPTVVSVVGSVATLTIDESTASNTSTGGMSISFAGNANWKDGVSPTANLASASSNITLADKSLPILTLAKTVDNSGFYAIDCTFSESVTATSFTGFSLSGTVTYTGSILQTALNTLRLVTTDSTSVNTAKSYAITYAGSGVSVRDSANNYLANFANIAVTDAIAPKILTRTTLDSNGNGHIDGIRIGFSEAVVGSLSGVTLSVAWYVVSSYSLSGTGITANLTESSLFDTSAIPAVQFQNTTVADGAGNLVASEGAATASTDAVGPVITNAIFDGVNSLSLTFSESLSGSFAASSFVLSGATATIASVSVTNGASIGTLTLSNSGITTGSSELSFSGNTVGDSLGNKQANKTFAKISASVILSEVMWSGTGSSGTQYIELHNLGASSVDISAWKIDNASGNGTSTLTIPASQTIPANGYYLVTATASAAANNLISVASDYAGSLSLSPTQTNSLVLKNASNIVYDHALSPWSAGDANIPASMERKSNPGDGLVASSWYTAPASIGFDTTLPQGTPRSVNIFDAAPPNITIATPTANTLFPIGNVTLSYAYSDAIHMAASPMYTLKLEKNTGTGLFDDVTATSLTSSGVNASNASFVTNTLAYGHYRATFTISDAALNQTQDIRNFYVDAPQVTIGTGVYSIGKLQVGSLVMGTGNLVITVKTIGAGFNLTLWGSGTMQAGIAQMATWSGVTSDGFGFTSTPSGSAITTHPFSAIAPTVLENIASWTGYLTGNGNLKTYTYTIAYGAKINALQAAGNYSANTKFVLQLQY